MDLLEKRLNEIKDLHILQERVAIMRSEVPTIYAELLSQESLILIEKLKTAKVILPENNLKIPDLSKFNNSDILLEPSISVQETCKQADNVLTCLSYLGK